VSAPSWVGLRDEYQSAVECRLRLGRVFIDANARGDHATREAVYPALEEARYAEEHCRIALQRATSRVVETLEKET
jgi:predicted GNAT family N-acyltransferase